MLGEPLRLGAGCEHSQSGPTDFQMSLRSPPPAPPSSSAPFLNYSAEERSADAVRPPQPPSGYGFSSDRPMLRFGAPGMTPPPTEVPRQDNGFGSVDRREQVDQGRHDVSAEIPSVGYSDAPLMDPDRDELRSEARFRYEHRQSPHDQAMEREFQQQPSCNSSTRSSDPCSRSSPPSDMIASNGDHSQITDIQIPDSNQMCSDVKIEADEPNKSTSNSPSPSECEGDITDTAGGELDTNGGLNALQRLQNALEKNGTFNVYGEDGITATGTEIYQCHLCSYTGSSKFNFSQHMHSHYDFQCSQCDFKSNSNVELKEHMKIEHNLEIKDFMDEPGVRVPRVNASGKIRLHKCKFCEYKTPTQMEHWEHLKSHIPPEKRFWCHVCPFITDVKHHLTYHLRNHFNSKPFKCNKCEYSCVNKSMLSSHMKSHTNFYQYRCADCSFAAKYANALKNHLRKEKHRPGMVLNPDGTPNPFVIIDVYGTRRGPKIKKDDNGMPILPSSIQENYVNFVQSQTKYIGSPTSQPPSFVNPYMQSEIGVVSPDSKLALPRGYIKCDMCPFSTPDRDLLTKHMMNHMTPDSQKDGKRSPPPPSDEEPLHRSNGVERMELLRSALAQPVRPLVSPSGPPPPQQQHHQGPPPLPPPIYRHQDLSPQYSGTRTEHAPAAETPRLPQYDPITAQRVREYFSRALQTPLLYNLSMAAGLNSNPPAPPVTVAGLPLPFSICRTPLSTQLATGHERVCSPQYVRVSSPQRPSSPPYYDHRTGNGFLSGHQDSPQPSTPPQQQLLRQHLQQHQLSLASETISPDNDDEVLDLSRLGKRSADGIVSMPAKHRRKGRAQRLEVIAQRLQTSGGGSPPSEGDSAAGSCSPPSDETAAVRPAVHSDDDWRSEAHTCQSCGIAFKDLVMYTMHMGFHDFRRPFSCNKCGEQCRDAIAFFLHIARVPHTS